MTLTIQLNSFIKCTPIKETILTQQSDSLHSFTIAVIVASFLTGGSTALLSFQ